MCFTMYILQLIIFRRLCVDLMQVNLSYALCVTFISTEQLNHAARHRNVYYDMVGGDPYGKSPGAGTPI